jgi:cysteine desulfurase family protein (TIGR01976 family)
MTKALDLSFVRGNFPALASGEVYLDNGGGTQVVADVIQRGVDYLTHSNVQPLQSSPGLAAEAARRLLDARRRLASWINADSDEEIVLGSSTTLLLYLLCQSFAGTLQAGDEIVVTDFDHEANIGPWVRLEATGIKILTLKVRRPSYTVSIEDLKELLSPRTRLVCLSHCSNVFGTINSIDTIADVVHDAGALLCVDGVGFAPHREIDVRHLKADFYLFSLYKTFGPHYALLYGRRSALLDLPGLNHFFIDNTALPYKLQPGGTIFELVYASAGIVDYLERLGARMTAATDPAERRRAAYAGIALHEELLAERLLSFLRERSDVIILGNHSARRDLRVPIVSFVVRGRDSREIAAQMGRQGLGVRCSDFFVYRYYHQQHLDSYNGILRVSFAHYNTLAEVDKLVDSLSRVL